MSLYFHIFVKSKFSNQFLFTKYGNIAIFLCHRMKLLWKYSYVGTFCIKNLKIPCYFFKVIV